MGFLPPKNGENATGVSRGFLPNKPKSTTPRATPAEQTWQGKPIEQISKESFGVIKPQLGPMGAPEVIGIGDIATGAMKGVGETLLGAGELGARGLQYITEPLQNAIRPAVQSVTEPIVGQLGKAPTTEKTFAGMTALKEHLTKAENPAEEAGKILENIAEFLIPAGAVSGAGKAIKGAKALEEIPQLGKIASVLGVSGLEGLAMGTQTALKSGEINQNVATNAAIGAALPIVGAGLKGGYNAGKSGIEAITGVAKPLIEGGSNSFQKEAIRQGIKDIHLSTIENFTPEEAMAQKALLESAKKRIIDPSAPTVYELAAQPFQKAFNQLKSLKRETGAALGAAKKEMASNPIEMAPIQDKITELLKGQGAIVQKKGKTVLDVANSSLSGSGVEGVVKKIWERVKSKKVLSAEQVEVMTKWIENKIGYGIDKVGKETSTGRAIGEIKKVLNSALGESDETFRGLNSNFARLSEGIQGATDAAAIKTKSQGTIISLPRALTRLLTSTPEKSEIGMQALVDVAKEYGIKIPENYKSIANMAGLVEQYAGNQQMRSMGGLLENAAGKIPGKVGKIIETGKATAGWLIPKNKSIEQINKVIEMINKAQQAKGWVEGFEPIIVGVKTKMNPIKNKIIKK